MLIKDILTRDVATIAKDNSVADAARKMAALDVGFLPVSEQDHDAIVGVVTDRDVTVRAVAEGLDPTSTNVGQVMTPRADFVSEEDRVEDAAREMKEKRIRRVLVRGSGNGLAGVVTLGDLAVALDDKGLYAEALEEVSTPAEPAR